MFSNTISEKTKCIFRRKSWTAYLKISSKQKLHDIKMVTLSGMSSKVSDATTYIQSPVALLDNHLTLHGNSRGQELWKKASESLVLPLMYVRVKESRKSRMLRQTSTIKLKIIQVNMAY